MIRIRLRQNCLLALAVGFVLAVLGLALTAGPAVARNLAHVSYTYDRGSNTPSDVSETAVGKEASGASPVVRLDELSTAQAVLVATEAGTSTLDSLPSAVRANVDDAIQRAASGKIRFPGHDGKVYNNSDNLLPRGNYTEWTAAQAGAKRGVDRVIIEGDPTNPNAIYYWDHVNAPVWIGP